MIDEQTLHALGARSAVVGAACLIVRRDEIEPDQAFDELSRQAHLQQMELHGLARAILRQYGPAPEPAVDHDREAPADGTPRSRARA